MYLYWIHLEGHTDPSTQGYIGITADPNTRFRHHTYNDANPNVLEAVRANTAIFTILHTFDNREDALAKEKEYRPESYIGWNICMGGGQSGKNHQMSDKGRANISAGRTGIKISEEGRAMLRKNHHSRKQIIAEGVHYNSCNDYIRETGRSKNWLTRRLKSSNYPEFVYK